jgi:DNA modification methylase
MKINCEYSELLDTHKLVPHPRNANKHPERQIDILAKLIDFQGWRLPIIVSKRSGFVVAGHGRLEAAKKLGHEKVPVSYQDFESEAQEFAFLISDNKSSSLAEHDDAFMIEGIKDLGLDVDFDLDLLALPDLVLHDIDPSKEEIEDEVPENVETRAKPGDLWKLGEHRLLCGDATNIQHVERLMGGQKFDLLLTDPPYNSNLDGRKDDVYTTTKSVNNIHETKKWDANFNVTESVLPNALLVSHLKSNYMVFPGWYPFWRYVFPFFMNLGDDWAAKPFIWCKKFAISNVRQSSFANATEPVIVAYRKGHFWNAKKGTENYDHILMASNEGGRSYDHPTSKPVALLQHLVEVASDVNHLVLDLFGGSGSTLIACEKTNRKCFMMEIDPHYCSVILERWEKYSGKTAELLDNSSPT